MSPHDAKLFVALVVYGRDTRGLPPSRVALSYPDGVEVALPVPAVPPPPEPAAEWPRADGWDFREGDAAFNGVRFRLGGKLLGILRVLAERPGQPVSADRLKREVWGEEPDMVEDANLHGHVSQLRRRLREALGLAAEDNPVTFFCGAYRLAIH